MRILLGIAAILFVAGCAAQDSESGGSRSSDINPAKDNYVKAAKEESYPMDLDLGISFVVLNPEKVNDLIMSQGSRSVVNGEIVLSKSLYSYEGLYCDLQSKIVYEPTVIDGERFKVTELHERIGFNYREISMSFEGILHLYCIRKVSHEYRYTIGELRRALKGILALEVERAPASESSLD